jgi:diguanylate cyclase (GGDEF)-like protein/PAS domain S-box-containing protein
MTVTLGGRVLNLADADFGLIAEGIPQPAWISSPDGVQEHANRRASAYLGVTPRAHQRSGLLSAAHPDDAPDARQGWNHALMVLTPWKLDLRLRRFDGEYRWNTVEAQPLRDENGLVVKWITTATDIDDSRTMQHKLVAMERHTAETLALLEALQTHAPVGFGFVDRDFRRVMVNERLAAYNNTTVAEQVGKLVPDLVPAFWPQLEPLYRSVLETGQPVLDVEVAGPSALDVGQTRHWINSYYPVALAEELIGIGIVAVEITERKKAEQANRRLATIVEQAGDAILGSGLDGIATSWNRAAESLFGYAAHEIIGQPLSLLAPGSLRDEQEAMRTRIIGGSPAERYETTRRRKDGSLVDVMFNCFPSTDEAGTVVGVSVIVQDITERIRSREVTAASQRRLAEAQQIAQVGSFEKDFLSGQMTWSAELYRLLGVDPRLEPTLELFVSLVHPDDRDRFLRAHAEAIRGGAPSLVLHRVVPSDGSDLRWVESRAICQLGEGGAAVKMMGTMRDNTERVEAARVKQDAERRFEIAFEQAGIGTAILNLQGVPTRVNAALCALFDCPPELLLSRSWAHRGHADEIPLDAAVAARVAAGNDTYTAERRFVRPGGSTLWAAMHMTLVRDENGQPSYYLVQVQDIGERKQLEADLSHQALHDPLTGLANRALLRDRLTRLLAGSRRRGTRVGVIFIDLDHFKTVNDSLGHGIGDDLLALVAGHIQLAIRPGDTVARFGGDEFVIVCEDADGLETLHVARQIRAAIGQHHSLGDQEIHLTASLGVALSDPTASPDSLLRDSDAAMFLAKGLGRDRVELFDDTLRERAARRLTIASSLGHALARHELTVHYQPVFDIATGALVSAEALLRWHHPDLGAVSPAEFIPLAEETGLIVPIGAWVIEQASSQLLQWQLTDPAMTVAVNLSVRQVLEPTIVATVAQVLSQTGLRPAALCLELTESAFMQDLDYFSRTLAELKSLGVHLSIDDFGTGYSSLSYLKNFPVDAVKIDRTFVDGLGTDQRDYALVSAILAMAQALELSTTAEGIENDTQLATLKSLGCRRAQGFHLSRPITAAAMHQLVIDGEPAASNPTASAAAESPATAMP